MVRLLLFSVLTAGSSEDDSSSLERLDPPLDAVLTAGSSEDTASCFDRLDPPLVGVLTAGSSGDNSSCFDRLDPLVVSFVTAGSSSTSGSSGDEGRLDPLLVSFLTAGVLGFFAGAPLLTGVALAAGGETFLEGVCFFAVLLADATAFLTGDFFARVRPLPLAFD